MTPADPQSDSGARLDPELASLQAQMLQLQAQGQNGASWFYWVAGLTLVNSLIALKGGGGKFLFGLGVTQYVEARHGGTAAFVFALVVIGGMVLCGWCANKRMIPMFAFGMILYLLDGLFLLLKFQLYFSAAFHAFVLFQMWQGLHAYRKLSTILRSQPAVT
jgi:hypothetical protein